jgi:hypothetical protein
MSNIQRECPICHVCGNAVSEISLPYVNYGTCGLSGDPPNKRYNFTKSGWLNKELIKD